MTRETPPTRADYCHARTITTRWMDNDLYGHVNNVIYYSWFDTAVNTLLIEQGLLDPAGGPTIGLVVESGCNFVSAVSFPQIVTAMVRVAHLGNSSVRYEIGLFVDGSDVASAYGHFVHVYVDRQDRRPRPLPDCWRKVLTELMRL